MLEGWEPKGKHWYLTRDRKVLACASFLGYDKDHKPMYRGLDSQSRILGAGKPLRGLDTARKAIEEYFGVSGATPDLREVGLQTVYRVRCGGPCGQYLDGGREWLNHTEALRAARDAGWLTREDLGRSSATRLVRCTDCRNAEAA